jgi:hypothetical protein
VNTGLSTEMCDQVLDDLLGFLLARSGIAAVEHVGDQPSPLIRSPFDAGDLFGAVALSAYSLDNFPAFALRKFFLGAHHQQRTRKCQRQRNEGQRQPECHGSAFTAR